MEGEARLQFCASLCCFWMSTERPRVNPIPRPGTRWAPARAVPAPRWGVAGGLARSTRRGTSPLTLLQLQPSGPAPYLCIPPCRQHVPHQCPQPQSPVQTCARTGEGWSLLCCTGYKTLAHESSEAAIPTPDIRLQKQLTSPNHLYSAAMATFNCLNCFLF